MPTAPPRPCARVGCRALVQRVQRMEHDRAQDAAELRAIRILVTRLCAVTPGCVES